MTVNLDKDRYLEKPKTQEKDKIKEQLLFGDGDSLLEVETKRKEYESKMLNEGM